MAISERGIVADMEGTVFDIQRFSVHDGPDIHTTVFLKGCPLRCAWCHNPESQTEAPCIALYPHKCEKCGACLAVCPKDAHRLSEEDHRIDRDACIRCGECAQVCDFDGLEYIGRRETVASVMKEVLRDKAFYENSGGGVTFSGGEPLMQGEFLTELLKAAKEEGLHVCIETSGFGDPELLRSIVNYVDLFLFDVKETDEKRHIQYVGVPFSPIRENLALLDSLEAKIVLRCPLIPDVNVREEHLKEIARIATELKGITEVNVMAYHILGNSKYEALDMENPMAGRDAMSKEEKNRCIETIREYIKKFGREDIKVC